MHLACISKVASRKVKRTEMWDSGTPIIHILGYIDLVGFKVIWGSFSVLFSKWPIARKGVAIERNGVKFASCRYW